MSKGTFKWFNGDKGFGLLGSSVLLNKDKAFITSSMFIKHTFLVLILLLTVVPYLQAEPYSSERVFTLSPGADFEKNLDLAVKAINAGKADVLCFTPGEFYLSKGLKFQKSKGQGGLRITGGGPGITKLIFSCKEAAIVVKIDTDIRNSSESPSLRLEELSLIATGECGAALDIMRGDTKTSGGTATKIFSNLNIDGQKGGSWASGIQVTDLTFTTFQNITMRLPRPGATGIHITGNTAPVDHHLSSIRILSADTGIKIGGKVEGVYIDQGTIIGVDTGIDWDTTSHEPLLAFSGSHISARYTCIKARNLLQPVITGNLLYQAGTDKEWKGIDITTERATNYDLLQISNNIFHGNPKHTVPNTGISINAGSAGVINANVFSALDVGIKLGEKAKDLEPSNNVFKGVPKTLFRE